MSKRRITMTLPDQMAGVSYMAISESGEVLTCNTLDPILAYIAEKMTFAAMYQWSADKWTIKIEHTK